MNQSDLKYVKQAAVATYESIHSFLPHSGYFLSSRYVPALLVVSIITVQANVRRHYSMAPENFLASIVMASLETSVGGTRL